MKSYVLKLRLIRSRNEQKYAKYFVEIQELLEYAKEIVHTLHEVQDDLTETKLFF